MSKINNFQEAGKIQTLEQAIDCILNNRQLLSRIVFKRIYYIFETYIDRGLGSKQQMNYEKKERYYSFGLNIFVMKFDERYQICDIHVLKL